MDLSERKEVIILSVFFLAYSLLFLIISILNARYEYIYYNVFMLLGFLMFPIFYRKFHLKVPVLISLVVLGFLHLAGGNFSIAGVPLYQSKILFVPYDKLIHVFGSFVITLLLYNYLKSILREKVVRNFFSFAILLFLISFSFGALVEIVEFLATLMFEKTIVGDYANNAGDLVANGVGVLLAVFFSWRHFKKN